MNHGSTILARLTAEELSAKRPAETFPNCPVFWVVTELAAPAYRALAPRSRCTSLRIDRSATPFGATSRSNLAGFFGFLDDQPQPGFGHCGIFRKNFAVTVASWRWQFRG